MPRIEIAPSVLPADFSKLGEEVAALEAAGVDRIQWDVMDGQFVPNLTFGPDVIASARKYTTVPFEAHLMVLTPDQMAAEYIDAGCQRLIVHAEACVHLHRTLGNITSLGAKASVALNPATPISAVAHVLDLGDMVLIMTVNPRLGGQQRSTEASARPPSQLPPVPAPTSSSPAAPCTATPRAWPTPSPTCAPGPTPPSPPDPPPPAQRSKASDGDDCRAPLS